MKTKNIIKNIIIFSLILIILPWNTTVTSKREKNTTNHFFSKQTLVSTQDNHPPFPPLIEGPNQGKIRTLYQYNITVDDPDEDFLLKMEIDFGEGKIITIQEKGCGCKKPWWKPNTTIYVYHKWKKPGKYVIKARVMDVFGQWSNWSTLQVNMERKITKTIQKTIITRKKVCLNTFLPFPCFSKKCIHLLSLLLK